MLDVLRVVCLRLSLPDPDRVCVSVSTYVHVWVDERARVICL